MKKYSLVIVIALLLVLLATSSVFADLPGTGWWSAIFVQNIGSDGGSVTMDAFDSTTSYGSDTFAFDYGQALAYDPGKTPNYPAGPYIGFTSPLPTGFEGAVVLSASIPVAAISEIANFNNGTVGGGGTASARYQGMSSDMVDTTLMVPTIKNNYSNHTTTLYVQAAGAEADVTVTFNMNNGNAYSQNVVVDANEMFVFDPSAAGVPSTGCGFDTNISPCYGSAEITSTSGPIAANVVEHPHTGAPAGYALSTRAQTPSDQDTILFHPTIKNNFFGKMTAGASIMNVGMDDALVQITLTVTSVDSSSSAHVGDVYTDTEVIAPGKSLLFSKWLNNLGGMPDGTFAAAVIESLDDATYDLQPLVGATNDKKQLANVTGGGITLYAGFADRNKTDTLAAPIVRELMGDVTGGITVQNVGSSPDKLIFEYYEYGTGNVYVFETTSLIDAGEAVNTNRVSLGSDGGKFSIISGFTSFSELGNKQFSLIVTSESGEPIIGLVSENSTTDSRDMRNYETINFSLIP